jgi:hypothetical protein
MLIVAAAGFASNFQKNASKKYTLLLISVIALITYCYMGYMRQSAEAIFAVFPLLAVLITPILGNYVDHKGKAASMLMFGSLLLILCHLTFAFILPMFKEGASLSSPIGGVIVAYITILVLGASFSLVPASLWPSVPKLVDSKVIGSAYALIFWIQNIGLWLFPMLIGKVLDNTNPELTAKLETVKETTKQAVESGQLSVEEGAKKVQEISEQVAVQYDYTWPLVMLALLGVAALIIGIILLAVDKKKHLGLEEPNIKPEEA